ncbi:MAG: anhydro-N-acetylmuramic acid kinase [Alphaproteobacteria bacterium]
MSAKTALGFMSGTSMDGVDAALLVTDGERVIARGPAFSATYQTGEREVLRAAMADAVGMADRRARPGSLAAAENLVTNAHIAAGRKLLTDHPEWRPDLVGFHGQTVLHAPQRGVTVQIGDAQRLADELGLPVVHDMRAADVAAGGEGAPLAPALHRALATEAGLAGDVAIVNIGGVANYTRIGHDGLFTAADAGPGNALLDDFMRLRTGEAMDSGGQTAASGTADRSRIDAWLADPWFARSPPKSLDRDAFGHIDVSDQTTEDGAATLTGFTSGAIVKGIVNAGGADLLVLTGGGAHNDTLVRYIAQAIDIEIKTADKLGWNGDTLEAQAFGFLAVRSVRGLALTFPGTTGVARPLTGGRLALPASAGPQPLFTL